MRTDRELLELAAKAAGIDGAWHEIYGTEVGQDACGISAVAAPRWGDKLWDPLTDDGDALRLAVKLQLWLHVEEYGASARRAGGAWIGCEAHIHGGIEAAARRAIVRAAAALAHPDNKDGGAVYG